MLFCDVNNITELFSFIKLKRHIVVYDNLKIPISVNISKIFLVGNIVQKFGFLYCSFSI